MFRTVGAVLLSVVFVLAGAALARSETLEEIIRQVEETSRSLRDMSCELKMEMTIMGQVMAAEGEMVMLMPNKLAADLRMKMPGMNMDMRMKMVSDGRVVYQEMDVAGKKMVNRIDAAAAGLTGMGGLPGMGGAGMAGFGGLGAMPANVLAELQKTMDVELVGETTLDDGQKAWIIKGKFKPEFYRIMSSKARGAATANVEALKSQMAGIRFFIGQKDKYMNKMEFISSVGKTTGSMTFNNLKLNKGVSPSRFQYKPPEGVQVNDLTKKMRAQMNATKGMFKKMTAAPAKKAAPGEPPSTVLKIGVSAPAFTVKTLRGRKLELTALRGKPALIFFWATWHTGSVGQLVDVCKIEETYRRHGIKVVALSLDEPGAEEDVKKTAKEKGVTVIAAIGNDAIFDAYWISEVPSYVLIDAEGKVLSSEAKPKDLSELKKTLEKVLKKAGEKVASN